MDGKDSRKSSKSTVWPSKRYSRKRKSLVKRQKTNAPIVVQADLLPMAPFPAKDVAILQPSTSKEPVPTISGSRTSVSPYSLLSPTLVLSPDGSTSQFSLKELGSTSPTAVEKVKRSLFHPSPDVFDQNDPDTQKYMDETASVMEHPLNIESTKELPTEEAVIPGNRIVDLNWVLSWAITLQYNHSKICTSGKIYPAREVRRGLGLVSWIEFKCTMCQTEQMFSTENPNGPEVINTGVVWGTLATGSTFGHTRELLSVMNIPSINQHHFYKIEKELGNTWKDSMWKELEVNGQVEKQLAIEDGDIDEDGIPYITVYLDGGWSKRSYGHSYNAASGVATIIGERTGKVLFVGVRNKYCIICARAANRQTPPPEHTCFKNWRGSSAAMEADIIAEGFKRSIELHGITYKYFIADGDSSVFAKIKMEVPYGHSVKKTECTNHAIKNFSKRLHVIKKDTKINIEARKLLSHEKLKMLVDLARQYIVNCNGNTENLKMDLSNIIQHIFGHHTNCRSQCCEKSTTEDILLLAKSTGIYIHLTSAVEPLIRKAAELSSNKNNNRAEQFMNILARFNAGKRLNLTSRGSFENRCALTSLRYNKGVEWHSSPWKLATEQSPGTYFKKYIETKRREENRRHSKGSLKQKKTKSPKKGSQTPNMDYGPHALQSDLSEADLKTECNRIVGKFQITEEERNIIAINSVGQFGNDIYEAERMDRLTSSLFGLVVKRRIFTPCHSLVKQILYKSNFTSTAIEYGKQNESVAIKKFSEKYGITVEESGLFIDLNHGFLATSPDGLVGNDYVVEVKCLHKVAIRGISLEEAAAQNMICLEVHNGSLRLKRQHNYYYQVQGQLNITGRNYCYFIVYVDDKTDIYYEVIEKDSAIWTDVMQPKLKQFFMECVVPELIYRRIPKGLKCVDPQYILEAQKKRKVEKIEEQ